MRLNEVNLEQRRNEGVGNTGDPRENPPTNGIVRHDSHLQKSEDRKSAGHRMIALADGSSGMPARIPYSISRPPDRITATNSNDSRDGIASSSSNGFGDGVVASNSKGFGEAIVFSSIKGSGYARNEWTWETGDPRENPPTSGVVRQDSKMRKSAGMEPGSPRWEESSLTTTPLPPPGKFPRPACRCRLSRTQQGTSRLIRQQHRTGPI
ncbi:hypothetical protein PR048_022227 [Dryococelus australis]|uniref:Uncharacterized protein n=1 Tax=Dryococelus australis TaxID=614101 RepID=A0ABQ9H0E3_9NEOP|nr:hypothetical protein PR048_022227 [Dryococelus australis]